MRTAGRAARTGRRDPMQGSDWRGCLAWRAAILNPRKFSMSDSDYLSRAETALRALEAAVDACGADVECTRSGNVLTLEFDDSKIIVNLQPSMHEIWVAAKSGGFHYRYRDGAWRNTRDDSELFEAISRCASEQAGEPLDLRAG
jgi:CyaY protein